MALPVRAINLTPGEERQFAEMATMFSPEPLNPELERRLEDVPEFGKCLRHPLVYCMLYTPEQNKMLNAMLKHKREAIARAMTEGDYSTVVWLHERPWRIDAFANLVAAHLTNEAYWRTLGRLWTDTENLHQNWQEWHDALHGRSVRGRGAMMTEESDRATWRKLRRRKTPIRVYRGWAGGQGRDGMSWSLSRSKATWFAQRFAGGRRGAAHVARGLVDGPNIIAYFDTRGEQEVVVLPENVTVLTVKTAL